MAWVYAVEAPLVVVLLVAGWTTEALRPGFALGVVPPIALLIMIVLVMPFLPVWIVMNLTAPRRRGIRYLFAALPGGRLREAAVRLGWNESLWHKLQQVCLSALVGSFGLAAVASVVRLVTGTA